MRILISFLAGSIFGIGLVISGMVNPTKVLGFLNIAGRWDPSLAFVMAGAIAIAAPAFALARRRGTSWLGGATSLPTTRRIDRGLVVGSLLFGLGWGLAGFCPGPSLAALAMGQSKALIFVAAMLAGMGMFELAKRRG
jgi:uncharacterized membrane protein YedE/YeeE